MARDPSPNDGETLLPDLLLGRYRVEGKLGEGGLGTVVKAFDTRLNRMVAVKTLKRSLASTDPGSYRALEDRFNREAQAGSRVGDHPNLVTVYDLVMDDERTQYLICQYVPGGTLADRITNGPLPFADALRLTADVARGLQAAHDAGIVHRDIKPSNIFLAADGRAQVGDFGIAQMDHLSGRTHVTTGHPGTPLYMSPEQAQTTGYVRPDTDQYSLGLVLFEMLTGRAYKRLREQQADALLAKQSPAVAALFRQMTAPRPDDRYDGMEKVKAAIRSIERQLVGTPVHESREAIPISSAPSGILRNTPHLDEATVRDQSPHQVIRHNSPPSELKTWRLQRYTRRAVLAGMGSLVAASGIGGLAAVQHYRTGTENTPTPLSVGTATTPVSAVIRPTPSEVPTTSTVIQIVPSPTLPPVATAIPTSPPSPTSTFAPTVPPVLGELKVDKPVVNFGWTGTSDTITLSSTYATPVRFIAKVNIDTPELSITPTAEDLPANDSLKVTIALNRQHPISGFDYRRTISFQGVSNGNYNGSVVAVEIRYNGNK